MKKLISIILLCATAVLLCACGSAAPDKSSSGGSAVPPMQTASGSDTQAAADAPEEKAAENEQKIIRLVAEGMHSLEELVECCGLPAPRLMCMVTTLEMEGVLERDAANVRLAGQE